MSVHSPGFPHLVIRASAGTGKTYQLTSRFLTLVAAGEPLDGILATTFTRKAAGEITDRVLARLAEAALDEAKCRLLAEAIGDPSFNRGRARELLAGIVHQLHRLRVGTLDSFFLEIARSFSLELNLPPGWRIVDEVMDQRVRAEAVQSVLEDESAHSVTRLMHLLTKGEASRSISRQIELLVADLYGLYVESPAGAWEAVPRYRQLTPERLNAAIEALAGAELPEGKRFPVAVAADLEHVRSEDWQHFLATGLAAKIVDGTRQYHGKPIPPHVVELYRPLIYHAKATLVGQIANQTEATFRLLKRFDEAYQRLKTARRELRFEDVTRRLAEAWVGERIGEVGFRLDAHLAHLLLDEFQDTSALQWRVLHPLAARLVPGQGRQSLFCVGDVKQAIYGWRGGMAEIFDALESQLSPLVSQSLNQSRRSSPTVIDTVNRVFERIAENPVLDREPQAAANWAARFTKHTTALEHLPGHCRLMVAPRAPEGHDPAAATLCYAARHVAELHRRAPGRTVGVLVRRNVAVARLIFELRRLGVSASEEGGNPLADSPAVQLVLSLLTLADHPGDAAARFHVAQSPLGKIVGLADHRDASIAWRLARRIRGDLVTGGYGPTLFAWVRELAPWCDGRDLTRLLQLVEMAYGYEPAATTRADDFVAMVAHRKVKDPSGAPVRVMTVHQAKGLQFDVVVLPELDAGLAGQTPQIVMGRSGPGGAISRVCRYVPKDLRPLLPRSFSEMFDHQSRQVMEESLSVLYVALTRAVYAMDMVIAPSRENERTIPASFAGLLRAALTDRRPAEPGTVLYEHGDPRWLDAASSQAGPGGARSGDRPQREGDRPQREGDRPAEEETLSESSPRPLAGEGPGVRADGPRIAAEPKQEAEPQLVVRLAEASPNHWRGLERVSPSQLEGGPRVNLAERLRLDTNAALNRGSLIHAWLAHIEWLDDGEPSDAWLARLAEEWDAGSLDVAALVRRFRAILAKPAIRGLLMQSSYTFSDAKALPSAGREVRPTCAVWRERPFALRDKDALYSGRIDRLVVLYHGDRAVGAEVIDFKTDALPPDRPAIHARLEVYRPQIEVYRRAGAALAGVPLDRVSAKIAFVEPGEVCDCQWRCRPQ